MEKYKIVFKRSVKKDFRTIPAQAVKKILERIRSLAEDPRPANSKKLSSREVYRLRIGRYRVLYEIIDQRLVILVVKVAHRSKVY